MTASLENLQNCASIPRTRSSWQQELANAFKDSDSLLEYLQIASENLPDPIVKNNFPTLVTQHFASLFKKGDPNDPLLKQVLSVKSENLNVEGFTLDPLEENQATQVPGIIHKYQGRVLMLPTSACAIHCRYCFRRHYDYTQDTPFRERIRQSLDYIRQHPDIEEIILSGGDPLTLADSQWKELIDQIATIPNIKRLRIHTRLPVVLPSRITADFIKQLSCLPFQIVMVLHINHAKEISLPLQAICKQLTSAKVTLLNQSVLLAGVNDDLTTLKSLSEQLFKLNILPYYLHLLDPVQGVAHFDVPQEKAKKLLTELSNNLPGYLVPKLVREEATKPAKTIIV